MFSKLRGNLVAPPLTRSILGCCIAAASIALLSVGSTHHLPAPETSLQARAASPAPQPTHRHTYLRTPRKLLSGVGSWYGEMFNGRATASGEIFDKDALTACHPTLPFGTLVRVINLRNRKSVVVRINDRGLRPDRVIDLSLAAADRIGLRETGLAPVRIIVLS